MACGPRPDLPASVRRRWTRRSPESSRTRRCWIATATSLSSPATWARYRGLVITDQRISAGRQAVAANRALFQRVEQRYGVGPGVIAGIWGLESSFGTGTGDFRVVEALATLAWEGRRTSFFRGELMAALKILDHGDIAPGGMTGSYAGAMGQPQFMPSSYLRYAVDFEGNGRRDIWTSKPDVLASIANYLAASGWRTGETWGQPVVTPAGVEAAGRDAKRAVSEWALVPACDRFRVAGRHRLMRRPGWSRRTGRGAKRFWCSAISPRSGDTTRRTTMPLPSV